MGFKQKRVFIKTLVDEKCKVFCGVKYTLWEMNSLKDMNKSYKNSVAIILGGNDVFKSSLKLHHIFWNW